MNRLTPDLMTADERLNEIGLILSRGIVCRLNKLKTNNSKDMRENSLDFREPGSIHGHITEGENRPCKTMY